MNKTTRQYLMVHLADVLDGIDPPSGPVGSTKIWGRLVDIQRGGFSDWSEIGKIIGPGKYEWDETKLPPGFQEKISEQLNAGYTAYSFDANDKGGWGIETGLAAAAIFVVVAEEKPEDVTDEQFAEAQRRVAEWLATDRGLFLALLSKPDGI